MGDELGESDGSWLPQGLFKEKYQSLFLPLVEIKKEEVSSGTNATDGFGGTTSA